MARILIVDDDPDSRRMLAKALAARGHRVCEAQDGGEALGLVLSGGIDLVILDISMPGMDGFVMLREVRALESDAARVPVIMLTAQSDVANVQQASRLAALEYFVKGSFDIHELLDRVDSLTG